MAPTTPSKDVSATTEDKWVRPSEVSTDRVRTSAPKAKSELEKAREAFAKAEEVGIEEGDSGIVETRMLRASEVRELLESAAEFEAQPPPMPAQPEMTEPGASPQPAAPAMPTPKTLEEGILGAKSSLVDKPAPPSAPTPPAEPIITPESPSAAPAGPPAPAAPTPPTTPEPPVAKPPPTALAPAPAPAAAAPTSVPVAQQIIPEVEVIEMKIPDSEYLKDGKISSTLTDLRHLHLELKQANTDLGTVTAHLDNDVHNCRTSAEVKRIHYESVQEQARLAKEEWNASDKEYRAAEDRRKKEILTRKKRIEKIQKSISKAESTVEKRVRDLEKEKEKKAQQEKGK
ncbi:MAG: hypothetical protein ACW98J_03070 [Candidatus Thorarchaeota archaeon]|jgi:hypothetical protein